MLANKGAPQLMQGARAGASGGRQGEVLAFRAFAYTLPVSRPPFADVQVNVASDHNLLLMDVMDTVAKRHNLAVLLHEKPLEGMRCWDTCSWHRLSSPKLPANPTLTFMIDSCCVVAWVLSHSKTATLHHKSAPVVFPTGTHWG